MGQVRVRRSQSDEPDENKRNNYLKISEKERVESKRKYNDIWNCPNTYTVVNRRRPQSTGVWALCLGILYLNLCNSYKVPWQHFTVLYWSTQGEWKVIEKREFNETLDNTQTSRGRELHLAVKKYHTKNTNDLNLENYLKILKKSSREIFKCQCTSLAWPTTMKTERDTQTSSE